MRITQPLSPCPQSVVPQPRFAPPPQLVAPPVPQVQVVSAPPPPPVHPTFLKSLTCNSPDVPRSVVEQENGGAIRHRRWRRDHMHPPITPEPNTAHTSFLTGANGPPSLSLCPLSSLDCYVILYHVLYLYHKRCKVPYLHYATFYIYIMIPPKYDTGACLVLSRESRQDKRRQDLRNRRFAL